MARRERESDRWRRDKKWQTCWCCRDQQRAYRMAQASAEKLEQTGCAEKERQGLSLLFVEEEIMIGFDVFWRGDDQTLIFSDFT